MIFREIDAFIARVEGLTADVGAVLDTITGGLAIAWSLIDSVRSALQTAEAAIKGAGRLIDIAANRIRGLPAPGVWRLIPLIAGGILEGMAAALKVLGEAVEALRERVRGARLDRLRELIERLEGSLGTATDVLRIVDMVLGTIRRICQIIEELKEQDTIERLFPALVPAVRRLLREWGDALLPVEELMRRLRTGAEAVDARVATVNGILGLLNGIEALRNAVDGRLGRFVESVAGFIKQVMDWIMQIPFVGWLLDKLNELIDAAAEALGVKKALDAIGAQIMALEFFQNITRFKDQLERVLDELEAQLAALEALIAEAERMVREWETRARQLLEELIGATIDKDLVEMLIPDWLRLSTERLALVRERIRDAPPAEAAEAAKPEIEQAKIALGNLVRASGLGPKTPFGEAFYANARPSLDAIAGVLERSTARPEKPELLLEAEEHLAMARAALGPYREVMAELTATSFDGLREALKQHPVGAAYLELAAPLRP
jgi:hypothetical protein